MTQIAGTESWLKRHERIVIVFLVLVAGLHLGHWTLSTIDSKARQEAAGAQTLLRAALSIQDSQAQQNAKNEATLAQAQQQYAQMVQSLQAQNAALQANLTQRDTALAQSQSKINNMNLPEVGKSIQVLENLPDSDISATASGLQLSLPGAQKILSDLESAVTLKQDNADDEQEIANLGKELVAVQTEQNDSLTVISGLKAQVADDAKTLADTKAADAKELKQAKHVAFKTKMHYFVAGSVTTAALFIAALVH